MSIVLKNNASTFIADAIDSVQTSFSVLSTTAFPQLSSGEFFYGTIESASGQVEIVKVTSIVGNSLTVVRAQEDTVAASFPQGSRFELRVTVGSVEGGTYTSEIPTSVSRTIQNRLQDVVSVKDFGAVGDGVTDDKPAFDLALATGNPVFVPKGDFNLGSTLTPPDDAYIYGEGKILGSSVSIRNRNITIKDIFCDTGLALGDPDGDVVLDAFIDGLTFGPTGSITVGAGSLTLEKVRRFTIVNCKATGVQGTSAAFITMTSGYEFNISNNHVIGRNGLIKGFCDAGYGVISNNLIDGGITGIAWISQGASTRRGKGNSVRYVTIENNTFVNVSEESISFDCNASTAAQNTVNPICGLCRIRTQLSNDRYEVELLHDNSLITDITTLGFGDNGEFVTVLTGSQKGNIYTVVNQPTAQDWIQLNPGQGSISVGSIITVGSVYAHNVIRGNVNRSSTGSLLLYGHCFNNLVENNWYPFSAILDVGVTNAAFLDNCNVNGFNILRNNFANVLGATSATFDANGTPVSGDKLKPYGVRGIENVYPIVEGNVCNRLDMGNLQAAPFAPVETYLDWYDSANNLLKDSSGATLSTVGHIPLNPILKDNDAKNGAILFKNYVSTKDVKDYESLIISKSGIRKANGNIIEDTKNDSFFLGALASRTYTFSVGGNFAGGIIKAYGYITSGGDRLQYIASYGLEPSGTDIQVEEIIYSRTLPGGAPGTGIDVVVASPSNGTITVTITNNSAGTGFFWIEVERNHNQFGTPAYLEIPAILN